MSIKNKIKIGDRVRVINKNEYESLPDGVRDIIDFNPKNWDKSLGTKALVVTSIKSCDFECVSCSIRKRFGFQHYDMRSMCGCLYTKYYTWKKL